jgi:hypothetical protein
MSTKKKPALKTATAADLKAYLEDNVGEYRLWRENSSAPGCCSTTVLHDFKTDNQINNAIDDLFADLGDEGLRTTKAWFVTAFKNYLVEWIKSDLRSDDGGGCHIALLADYQSLAIGILVDAGFVNVGTYPGNDSDRMTVLVHGLTRTRR